MRHVLPVPGSSKRAPMHSAFFCGGGGSDVGDENNNAGMYSNSVGVFVHKEFYGTHSVPWVQSVEMQTQHMPTVDTHHQFSSHLMMPHHHHHSHHHVPLQPYHLAPAASLDIHILDLDQTQDGVCLLWWLGQHGARKR